MISGATIIIMVATTYDQESNEATIIVTEREKG